MSSPSSAGSSAGKRKRTSTLPSSIKTNTAIDQLQPSSRDASGEEGESTAPESGILSSKKTNSIDSNPPAKRLRASTHDKLPNGSASVQDPGEPSDTTEASTDIASRVGRRGRKSASKDAEEDKTQAMGATSSWKVDGSGGIQNQSSSGWQTCPSVCRWCF